MSTSTISKPLAKPRGRPARALTTKDALKHIRAQQNRGFAAPKYSEFGLKPSGRSLDLPLFWEAANEVTHKVTKSESTNAAALGFVIKIECTSLRSNRSVPAHDDGWWARVGTAFSFGPTTIERAKGAVEAFLRREPLPCPRDSERYRKGDLWRIVSGGRIGETQAPIQAN